MSSREKSSRGSDSPRRPTRSDLRNFICKSRRPPAELARENFSTAGHARRCETESEKRSSENLIRQRGQRNDLNPGEFASRASLRSCLGARRRARWISARSMREPGCKSVRCQNLHEPLLSPCMFEPMGKSVRCQNLHEPYLSPCISEQP